MKKSNYNFFYQLEQDILAYNARTNVMAVIEQEKYEQLKNILRGEESEDKKFVEELTYGGFIVENHVNELEVIRHDMYANRFSNNGLVLTIAPTSDCNFRCPYCYEKDVLHLQRMTDEIADKIVEMVENKASGIGSLRVTWYGGEPLLEFKRIEDLSKRFMKICEEHEVVYNAGIVTNGYLLTKEVLQKLIEYRVGTIQITLDGTKEMHDSKRYLKNHGGTFEKIMSNLLSFKEIVEKAEAFPQINVRMNIDRKNTEEPFKLLEQFHALSLTQYTNLYIAGVYDRKDIENKETLNEQEFQTLKLAFMKKYEEKGVDIGYRAYYPRRITSHCCCDRSDSLVIDAHGNLYKCWEQIGDISACIGQIGDEQVYNLPKCFYEYMVSDATLEPKCQKCEILPVCMGGGCPERVIHNTKEKCLAYKQLMDMSIEASAKKLGKSIVKRIYLE
ncbi:MAG: radical SAM protein [Lachnospiraceae bacterium]|nr:radical SAM protein [Lachnospiraceae bacterium]